MRWLALLCWSAAALVAGTLASPAAGQAGLTTGGGGYALTLHAITRATGDTTISWQSSDELEQLILEVSVQNRSDASGSYGPGDFVVRDQQLQAYAPLPVQGEPRLLGEGPLAPGESRWGWLAFEIPAMAPDLRLEYTPPPLRAEESRLVVQLGAVR
jgi:hypothetical protein